MKERQFNIADLHCHPNLKTFGHSLSIEPINPSKKSHIWYYRPPTKLSKIINVLTGLTKFSQTDFTTMTKANVKIAFVSLYPFEKGFFINGVLNGPISAQLANIVTSIGYKRVRHIQKHNNYFKDLQDEYNFLLNSCKETTLNDKIVGWEFANSWNDVVELMNRSRIAVILTIEGAHVLNSGLSLYGKNVLEEEVLSNIQQIKKWQHPPLFITFAHNFNNDFCGHASSLAPLGSLVNQKPGLGEGFGELGYKVVKELLNDQPIYIDVKHMSILARQQYYQLIEREYRGQIPIIVSHGAVTGTDWNGNHNSSVEHQKLCQDDINFFDEELIMIAKTGGLFSIQLDGNRLTPKNYLNKTLLKIDQPNSRKQSALIVWRQLQHIAEVLDKNNLNAWNVASIGSDFDGTINPLNGIWSSVDIPKMGEELLIIAGKYLKKSNLKRAENRNTSPEQIVENFTFKNATNFLSRFYIR
jgi:microsomal dipeptidase-like Zn-dependent dipeptidase